MINTLFLIFTFLHTWEYVSKDEPLHLTKGKWFRLVFSLLFIFWVMLSGFILKADHDSLQARQILSTLLSAIPFIGKEMTASILGPENNFQLINHGYIYGTEDVFHQFGSFCSRSGRYRYRFTYYRTVIEDEQ